MIPIIFYSLSYPFSFTFLLFHFLTLRLIPKNFEGKCEGKRMEKKIERKKKENKNRFKINKLFLYYILNIFHGFNSSIYRLNNFKIQKFLNNFNYI